MAFELELDSKNEVVRVKSTCQLNQTIRKNILTAVADQLEFTGFTKVLIDLSETTFNPEDKMTGALELLNYMRSLGIKPEVKFAFTYSDGEPYRKYFEQLAKEFDQRNLKYFKSLDKAHEWLEIEPNFPMVK